VAGEPGNRATSAVVGATDRTALGVLKVEAGR